MVWARDSTESPSMALATAGPCFSAALCYLWDEQGWLLQHWLPQRGWLCLRGGILQIWWCL